jgi:hypothetical protein
MFTWTVMHYKVDIFMKYKDKYDKIKTSIKNQGSL